jgi:hypothetical protein
VTIPVRRTDLNTALTQAQFFMTIGVLLATHLSLPF